MERAARAPKTRPSSSELLASRVKPFQCRSSAEIRGHAAHGIVRRGTHGRRLQIEIDAMRQAGRVNPWEAIAHEILPVVGEIEVDVL